jgi:hypothetical protein
MKNIWSALMLREQRCQSISSLVGQVVVGVCFCHLHFGTEGAIHYALF